MVLSYLITQLACGGRQGGGGGTGTGKTAPHFKPGFNLFKPEQDIELGRQSAQEVSRQMPLLNDSNIVGYVQQLGKKLAARAGGFAFPYQFSVVASKDINAFALPGGFIFVNAGAIAAAKNEGELAGVMSHEISHVSLRHGTNQATKAYIAKAGLSVLSGILGGESSDLGQIIGAVGGVGANALFLKFGRTAESQADLEGARIMAEAGYDPRDTGELLQDASGAGRAKSARVFKRSSRPRQPSRGCERCAQFAPRERQSRSRHERVSASQSANHKQSRGDAVFI